MSEETPEYQIEPILEPLEQETLDFYGQPLPVVRLPDGSPAVVFLQLCKNMGLDRASQYHRIRRKKALARGYHTVRIQTEGGPQVAGVLTLRVLPGWLFDINADRASESVRADIERYQDEAMDVLYQWAATSQLSAPAGLVPAEQIVKPVTPDQGASIEQWRDYYQRMLAFTDWQLSIEQWRGSVEGRLESLETIVPVILERLPDPTITPAHQNMVKYYVSQIHKATGKPYATIYSALDTVFQVPRYQELREDQWDKIERWFQKQLPGQGHSPEQEKLF